MVYKNGKRTQLQSIAQLQIDKNMDKFLSKVKALVRSYYVIIFSSITTNTNQNIRLG